MGKKSERKTGGKKGDAGKRPKLPKRIAGIKLSKELRQSGDTLLAAANSTIGREMLASGLMAAIGAAIAQRSPAAQQPAPYQPAPHQPAPHQPSPPPPESPSPEPRGTTIDPTEAGARAARQIVDLIGGAATAALARYREENRKD